MKHLQESIFDTDFDGDLPYMKLPHWKECMEVLKKIREDRKDFQVVSNRRRKEYTYTISKGTDDARKLIKLIDQYGNRKYGLPRPSGCYAFYNRGVMYLIDFDRDIRLRITICQFVTNISIQKNDEWIPDSNAVYKIDPPLIDMIKDILLS